MAFGRRSESAPLGYSRCPLGGRHSNRLRCSCLPIAEPPRGYANRTSRQQQGDGDPLLLHTLSSLSNAFNYRRNVLYHDFHNRVRFLLVDPNANESLAEVKSYTRQSGFDMPVYRDPDGNVAALLAVRATTDTFVLGSSWRSALSRQCGECAQPGTCNPAWIAHSTGSGARRPARERPRNPRAGMRSPSSTAACDANCIESVAMCTADANCRSRSRASAGFARPFGNRLLSGKTAVGGIAPGTLVNRRSPTG